MLWVLVSSSISVISNQINKKTQSPFRNEGGFFGFLPENEKSDILIPMIQNTLQHLGYSEKEARIYLALLELGTSPASTIARFLSENRITIYSVLKVLVKKGLILESKKNTIQVYTALAPEILIEQERSKYEQLKNSLPELLSLMNTHTTKPRVTFYE